MKKCTGCCEEKIMDEFYDHPKGKDGKHGICKTCYSVRAKSKSFKKDTTLTSKVCNNCETEQHPSEFSGHRRRPDGYSNTCKTCDRERMYKSNYGLTISDYDALLAKQNNCCDICLLHVSQHNKHLHVDHDHSTGEVRGLLCENCNRGIGLFQDDTVILENAIKYLNK